MPAPEPRPEPAEPDPKPPTLAYATKGVEARGYESNAGFVILQGSHVVGDAELTPTCTDRVKAERQTLKDQGILLPAGKAYVFTQDHAFNSPSLAAGIVYGGTANGRTLWKDDQGRSLNDLQQALAPGMADSP